MPPPNRKKRSWGLILFSLPFAAVAIGLFAFSILPALYDALRMSSWPSTQAELVHLELTTNSDSNDSPSYKVQARYRYQVDGVYYSNDRVAISIFDADFYPVELSNNLKASFDAKKPITIWYNLDYPADSIINRTLGLKTILSQITLAVGMLICGIGGIVLDRRSRNDSKHHFTSGSAPWLHHRPWRTHTIRSDFKNSLWDAWSYNLLWNGCSLTLAIFLAPKSYTNGDYLVLFFILLFPIIGLIFWFWVFRVTITFLKQGDPLLNMHTYPGVIGGELSGSLEVNRIKTQRFKIRISCLCINRSHDDTLETPIWTREVINEIETDTNRRRLSFQFDIPSHLPKSDLPKTIGSYYAWTIAIESLDVSPLFTRQYTVPVFAL